MSLPFEELGYRIADPGFAPHESTKHGFLKLEKDGRLFFGKYSKDHSTRQTSITTDIWWSETIQRLNHTEQLPFRTPSIVEHATDWYIAEWIEGTPSVQPIDPASRLDKHLGFYADCLAALDALPIPSPQESSPDAANSTPFDQLDKRWERWAERPLAEGILKQADLDAARKLVADHQSFVEPRLQHGDFVPWHILHDDTEQYWIIDGEHASFEKPRYYDLAYMHSRIYTRLQSPVHAAKLLEGFLRASGKSVGEVYPSLLPVLTSRAIGMHVDALNDLHHTDYRKAAQNLLERCLSRDPALLFTQ